MDAIQNRNNTYMHKNRYHFAITFRSDGISNSISDTQATLIPDAIDMLKNEDYVGFFMTCGPKYVRAINRAQEITSLFSFDAYQPTNAQAFAKALNKYVKGVSTYNRHDQNMKRLQRLHFFEYSNEKGTGIVMNRDILDSLTIEIFAYGLALNKGGTETLVATTLDEFHQVIKFALQSMGRSYDNDADYPQQQPGMIYSIEVVPWIDNPHFYDKADMEPSTLHIRSPPTLLEDAKDGFCSGSHLTIDDHSKCCEPHEIVSEDQFGQPLMYKTCHVYNALTPAETSRTIETNSEFVVRLGSVVKEKIESIATLGQCVNSLRSFPKRLDYSFLHTLDKKSYNYDSEIMKITVKELRAALDPTEDLKILSVVGREQVSIYWLLVIESYNIIVVITILFHYLEIESSHPT